MRYFHFLDANSIREIDICSWDPDTANRFHSEPMRLTYLPQCQYENVNMEQTETSNISPRMFARVVPLGRNLREVNSLVPLGHPGALV